jgi:hypothetical protein
MTYMRTSRSRENPNESRVHPAQVYGETLKIELPAPHDGQRQVLAEARRFNVVCCGRRFGKSTLGIDRIVEPALAGFPTAWFSPTYKMLLDSWRALQDVLAPVVTERNNAEFRLALRGSGSVTMFSLDSDVGETVRGRAFKCVVIDEAALIRNLRGAWEGAIRPTLADHRGDAWFLSTPRGMNDFKLFFDRGQDSEREDWASWQMPTSSNPYIAVEEIAAARAEMTEAAFDQEFSAQFVNWEGAVFRRISEAATAERKDGPEPGHEYVIGADWGRTLDYTVFTVIDTTSRCMRDMDRSNRVDYTVQRGRLKALYEKWRPVKIIAEQNSIGQPIIETLQRDGLPVQPFVTTNATKAEAIEALALAFEQGSIAILSDPVLLGELQAFAAEQLPSGMLRYSAPGGSHDDCVMSLALAWTVIRPAPILGLYSHLLTPDIFYDDATCPRILSGWQMEHWIVAIGGATHVYAEFFDDGETLFLHHEYVWDPRLTGRQKTELEHVDDLIQGAGEWPGLGPQPRRWPGVLTDPEAISFRTQLLARGVYAIDAEDSGEEGIRRLATLLAQKKLRVHKRCENIRRAMETLTWDEFATTQGKRRPDPCRLFVSTRIGAWRLTA